MAKLTKPKRNRSRDRQRVEILQLRAEAEVLQQRVAQMKKHQQEADREDNGNGIIASATQIMQMHHGHRQLDAMRFEVWRDLAERCRRLRRESENDNRNLRHLYKSQVATIETLKKMFQMQERVKTSIRFNARYYVNSSFDADEDALITMKCLQGGLGQLKDETDHVLLSNGLCAITSPFSQINMNSTSETSTYIEVLNCRVIPFDYKVVGEAFWYEMTKNYVENEVEREQPHEEAKKTAILQAFTLELEEYGSPVKIQFRYAGNRNIDLSREVIVVSGQSRFLEAFGMAVDGVHMVEKNWLVLSELAPGMCVVKVCMGLSVNVECNLPNRQQFVDRLNELLARQKQMSFESVLQGVEQSLLIS
ncbi:hypothetical protein KRP22_014520 [Phytophthora ramorum]|nr:hypothetical protein KRP22_8877 [Phytophthora ramorum]